MTPQPRAIDAVVLAGGTSRRWAGTDKTAAPLAGVPLLAHAVRAVLPLARAVAVVAPPGHPARDLVAAEAAAAGVALVWTREDPPGAGPLAGLAAGLRDLPVEGVEQSPDVVVVLAGDLPFAGPACRRLAAAVSDGPSDAAVGVDPDGRRQPLLAAYRRSAALAALDGVPVVNAPLRLLLDALTVEPVPVSAVESLDLDTPEEAARASRVLDGLDGLEGLEGAGPC